MGYSDGKLGCVSKGSNAVESHKYETPKTDDYVHVLPKRNSRRLREPKEYVFSLNDNQPEPGSTPGRFHHYGSVV